MRVELTMTEVKWLADLVNKDKVENDLANQENPHPLYELRRDNMRDLENKLNAAIARENKRERSNAR